MKSHSKASLAGISIMNAMKVLFLCLVFGLIKASDIIPTRGPQCQMTPAYPPDSTRKLDWYEINLDNDAKDRWNEPATVFKEDLIKIVALTMNHAVFEPFEKYVENDADSIIARWPQGYGDELVGISTITGIELSDLILYNMAVEIFGYCTSIVAQDTNGNVYHGRNLDFGTFPAANWTDDQWELTQMMIPTLFNANFTKNGETLYQSVVFMGYIGLLTGIRENGFTITVDSRYDENFDKYLLDWFLNRQDTSQFISFATRQAMESYSTYTDAVNYIEKTPLVGPAYIIIGGVSLNEGSVITLGPNLTLVDYWDIANGLPFNNGSSKGITPWYVLETNYDHWEQPPKFDDRRYPAENCMNEIGSNNINFETLYNVLNGMPNRNRLTTYTALMNCKDGSLESYKQYCDEPDCPVW